MPLLLYCVTQLATPLNSQTGVGGSAVERFENCGLSVFFSRAPSSATWLKLPLKDAAREFHKIQQNLFSVSAIIPFRFPAVIENEDELLDHLNERAAEYKELLDRFSNSAQMDIVLTQAAMGSAKSGTAYLRERQARTRTVEQAAEQFHHAAKPVIQNWSQRSTSTGLRCFALLERKRVQEFNETIRMVSVPANVSVRVSGPWPVAEFLDVKKLDINSDVRSNP